LGALAAAGDGEMTALAAEAGGIDLYAHVDW